MDIGDPSEIPATRRKLPSMQELGAFEFDGPSVSRAPADAPAVPLLAASTVAPARPAKPEASPALTRPAAARATAPSAAPDASAPPGPRTAPTAEQLRQALSKADPGTRQKLLRLIAGGRTVQQLGPGGPSDAGKRRSLVMPLHDGTAARPPAPTPAASLQPGRRGPAAVMQIDETTELLDAVPPLPSPSARLAELQAQADQIARPAAGREHARQEPPAHKVLFPAYDPARHGEDVHGSSRRRHEGPIEGHYPAPRQPFKPAYTHPDGRPMTAEENQAEAVRQTERCEETLGVLARDGVNGLLLSPRDLDAAVAAGVISAEAAATLWRTWAALRPVIHVIEDEPTPAAAEAPADETSDEPAANGEDSSAAPDVAPAVRPDVPPASEPQPEPDAEHRPASGTGQRATAKQTAATPAPAAPHRPEPGASDLAPTVDTPTLAAPEAMPPLVTPPSPAASAASAASLASPGHSHSHSHGSTPATRLKALLRTLAWLFIAYCILTTSSRLALGAWQRWGHWIAG